MKQEKINVDGLIIFIVLLITLVGTLWVVLGYQLPMLMKLNKQGTCLDHGFYDYRESTNECVNRMNAQPRDYDEVKKHKHWGLHCQVLEDCVKLKEEVSP